jgi:hypothetical protein
MSILKGCEAVAMLVELLSGLKTESNNKPATVARSLSDKDFGSNYYNVE